MSLPTPRALRLTTLLRIVLAALSLACAGSAAAQDWTYHARPGDTLWDLGTRYLKPSISWQELQSYNVVADPYRLPTGQVLRFPIAWLRVEPAPARVLAVRGPVQVVDGNGHGQPARQGMQLQIGSEVSTGSDASITLAFADDSHLQLRENSQLRLDQLSSYGATGMVDTRLRLQRGRSSNRVTPARGPASRYMITAPTATSSVRGTVFRVSAGGDGPAAATEVVQGRVQVGNPRGQRLVAAGQAAASTAGRDLPMQALPPAPRLEPATLRVEPLPLLADWQALPEASGGYRVEVVRADTPEILLFARNVDEPRVQIDALPPGRLRLLVRAVTAEGIEGHDAEHDFEVADTLPPPVTLWPLHGQHLQQARPRFEWAVVPGASGSVLQVAREPQFRQPLLEQAGTGNRLRAATDLPAGDYYWRVASRDAQGRTGAYGQPLPLHISDTPVDPQWQSPQSARGQLTLRWQAGLPGQRYHVQIDRRDDFSQPLLDQELAAPEVSLKQPWRGGTLFMRVRYIDDDGYAGPYSPVQQLQLPCRLCYGAGAAALLLLAL